MSLDYPYVDLGWGQEWRRDAEKPVQVERHEEYGLGVFGSRHSMLRLPRVIHPLDEHLYSHAEYLREMLRRLDRCVPSDLELLNRSTIEALQVRRDEALQLYMKALQRGADHCLLHDLNVQLDAASEWLEIAHAAQRLVGNYADKACRSCEHWGCKNFPSGNDGWCAARKHDRTGDSNACAKWFNDGT